LSSLDHVIAIGRPRNGLRTRPSKLSAKRKSQLETASSEVRRSTPAVFQSEPFSYGQGGRDQVRLRGRGGSAYRCRSCRIEQ